MWIRLFDPRRTPAHWLDIIRPGQYCVFVVDATTGSPRDAGGQPFREGEAGAEIAPAFAETVRFAESVVAEHPDLRCDIYDHGGKSGEPLRTIYNPSRRGRFEGLPFARREFSAGVGIATIGVTFIVYDAVRDLRWLWGYIIGVKMLVIGGSFLVRGLAGICEHWFGLRHAANARNP